jgi:hypothetical protein
MVLVALIAAGSGSTVAARTSPVAKIRTPLRATGVIRWGDSYAKASGYDRFSYVLVGRQYARLAARLPGTSLVYTSGTDVPVSWSAGVSYVEARANNWLLKDAAGAYVTNVRYGAYIGDIGSLTYQNRFISNVLALLTRTKADGVFIDDAHASFVDITGGAAAANYPTQAAWEDAMVSFLSHVGRALKDRGFYVAANAGKFVPGDPRSDTAATVADYWRRIAPSVSGLVTEYWLQSPLDVSQLRAVGSDWYQNWDGWQGLIETAQRAGDDFFGVMYGSAANLRAMRFGRASFLLDWNGRGGAFLYSITDHDDPYASGWVTQFGLPVRPKLPRAPGVWQRRYARGLVIVNATNAPVTIRANGDLRTIGATDAIFAANPR